MDCRNISLRWIYVLLCIAFIFGCSRKERVESDCFHPFSMLATEYFGTNSPQIWKIIGGNAGDEFLMDNEILGFLVERDFAQYMTPLPENGLIEFTGRVYKFWPSWPERYIGGGKNNIKYEVVFGNGKYLVFDDIPRNKHLPKISGSCDF